MLGKIMLTCLFLLTLYGHVFADIPHTLNYQGRLMNPQNQPVADGQYSVSFHLYDAAIGGTEKWSETQSVFTSNGYFNTVLGNTSALNASIFDGPLWVGIKVGNNAEMVPRQKLGAAAYAMTVADGAVTAIKMANAAVETSKLAEGSITTTKIADSAVTTEKIEDASITTSKLAANTTSQVFDFKTESNVELTSGATWYDLLSEEISVSKPCHAVVMAKSSVAVQSCPDATVAYWQLQVNGNAVDQARERMDSYRIGSASLLYSWAITEPGTYALKYRGYVDKGGTSSNKPSAEDVKMTVLLLY